MQDQNPTPPRMSTDGTREDQKTNEKALSDLPRELTPAEELQKKLMKKVLKSVDERNNGDLLGKSRKV